MIQVIMILLFSLTSLPIKSIFNLQDPGFEIAYISISSDSKYVAGVSSTGHVNGNVVVWNMNNGRIENILKTSVDDSINVVRFSIQNDSIIFANFDKKVKFWNFKDNKVFETPDLHPGFINTIAISPCGKYIASGDSESIVYLWNANDYTLYKKFVIPNDLFINAMDFSPDGKSLAIGGYSPCLHIIDIATGNIRISSPLYQIRKDKLISCTIDCLAFTSDGKNVVIGGWCDKLSILSVDTLKVTFNFDKNREDTIVTTITILPDQHLMVTTDIDGFIMIWDLLDNKMSDSIKIIKRSISTIGVVHDGKNIYVCTCYVNHSVALWKLDEAKLKLKFVLHPGL